MLLTAQAALRKAARRPAPSTLTRLNPAGLAALFAKQTQGLRFIDSLDRRLKSLGIAAWVDADMDGLVYLRIIIERTWMTAEQAMDTVEQQLGVCPFNTVSVSLFCDLPLSQRMLVRSDCVCIGGVQSV